MQYVTKLGLFQRLRILTMVPSGKHIHDRRVNYYRTREIMLEFRGKVPYHLDGELFFDSSFDIKVIPGALKVIYMPGRLNFFSDRH